MKKLRALITELEKHTTHYQKTNSAISQSTIGWQIEHTLLVIIQITKGIEKSNPEEYKWKFNSSRFLVKLMNKIPRGKAKAPKQVIPLLEITPESIDEKIKLAKQSLINLDKLNSNHFFKHHSLGNLDKKNTINFLNIHSNHHLKIIKDILK